MSLHRLFYHVAFHHSNKWDLSLRNLSRSKFMFRFLLVYLDCSKVSNLLHIHSSHHHPQGLFHFLGPPTKSLTLSLICCEHPLIWQNIKKHIYLDSHFFSLSDLLHSTLHLFQLSRCMVLLVSFLPIPLRFCPFCPMIFSVAFFYFLISASRCLCYIFENYIKCPLISSKRSARGQRNCEGTKFFF